MAVFRVLYVDDEPSLLELGRIFLEQGGQFSVDTIQSATDALALLGTTQYDAIVSDYMMPDMDGIAFLKKVRTSGNSIPFILFTGRGREEVVIQALNEGADFYLQKGGDPTPQFTELSHKIRQAVQKRQAERMMLESQAQLRTVVDSIPMGILIVDAATHRILDVNPNALDLIGTSRNEIIGNVCHRFVCPTEEGKCPVTDMDQQIDHSERVLLNREGKRIPILKSVARTVIDGNDVLVESFFDITDRKRTEEEIWQRNQRLIAISDMEREFAGISSGERVEEGAAKKLLAITGAVVTTFNVYDRDRQLLRAAAIEIAPGVLQSLPDAVKKVTRLVGVDPLDITVQVTPSMYQDIQRSYITTRKTITDICDGTISPAVSAAIQKLAAIDRFLILTHVIDGELYGTSLLALRADQPDPPMEILDSFAHIVAVSLRRQRAEAALRESDERLREIAENISTVFYIYERATRRFVYVSPAYEKIWGRTCRSLLDDPSSFLKAVLPEDLPALQDSIRRDLAEDAFVDTEYRIRRQDGAVRWIHTRNFPIPDIPGKISRVAGIAEDITELKASRSALSESESKFRLLVENSLESTSIIDFSGNGLFANRATMLLLELDDGTMPAGRNVMEFIAPESREQAVTDIARVTSGQDNFIARYAVLTANKNTRYVECIGKVISYEGHPAILISLHDITRLKRAQDTLKSANRQLTLLSGITRHDILNKVSVIRGFLQIARKKAGDPVVGGYLDRITEATEDIRTQIEFTRVYQDLGTNEPQWLSLDEVIPRSGIPPSVTLTADGKGIEVFADPMLRVVFTNLLDNSIRHGGNVTGIQVSSHPAGKDLVIVWEDNGAGIAAGEKERIFERGYGKNTGLGMFLAREILALTGITIRETGEPGRGARFDITVPEGEHRTAGG